MSISSGERLRKAYTLCKVHALRNLTPLDILLDMNNVLTAFISHEHNSEEEVLQSARRTMEIVPSIKVLEVLFAWAMSFAGYSSFTYLGSAFWKLLASDIMSLDDEELTEDVFTRPFALNGKKGPSQ